MKYPFKAKIIQGRQLIELASGIKDEIVDVVGEDCDGLYHIKANGKECFVDKWRVGNANKNR